MDSPDIPLTELPLRDRLLHAALDGLRDLTAVDLLHAVGAREIAKRADASAASINHHYGSLSGLADAVLFWVFNPDRLNPPRINELLGHIQDSNLPLPAAFGMHEAEFTRMTTDPEFRLRMGLWALGGNKANERYGVHLASFTTLLEEATDSLFESWGRELRPPVDTAEYLAMKIALITGVTLRQLTNPDDRWLYVFQRATLAIDLVMLRTAGDRHDLDARLTEMNYFPFSKKRRGANERSRRTVARILHAANELFSTQGFHDTTLDQISKHADVGHSTLNRYYPSKHEIAVALVILHAAEDPVMVSLDDPTGLPEHLANLAHFTRRRPTLMPTYLSHLIDPTVDHGDDPLVTFTQAKLDHDLADGRLEIATALVMHTVRRALTHLTESAEDVAAHAQGLIQHAG